MQQIIYYSNNTIPWDTQSAFKIYNYYTEKEEHRIFCYLKQYVQNGDLITCSYCFNQNPSGKSDIQLALNLNPFKALDYLHLTYGIDGFESVYMVKENEEILNLDPQDGIAFNTFSADDEQGYYWCFEIRFTKEFIEKYFQTTLQEKSLINLNMYQIYNDSSDYSCLFESKENNPIKKHNDLNQFLILNY